MRFHCWNNVNLMTLEYCWNLFSGDRDHVTALSGDHIISETKTVRSDGERIDTEEKQKKTG